MYTSLFDYSFPLLQSSNLSLEQIAKIPHCSHPPWLLQQADFLYSYGDLHKKDSHILLVSRAIETIYTQYNDFLRVYTDGSVTDTSNVGAAFVIPNLNVKKKFHLTKGCSIFTAELFAIMMALNFFNDMPVPPPKILILSDSKSALLALHRQYSSDRLDILFENLFLIHQLISRGCDISLLWIPGHSNLHGNEMADFCAKEAASNMSDATVCDVPISVSEASCILSKHSWVERQKNYADNAIHVQSWDVTVPQKHGINPPGSIPTRNLIHRLRVNAWLGRFLKPTPLCVCGQHLEIAHFLFDCEHTAAHFSLLHDKLSSLHLPFTLSSILHPHVKTGWDLALLSVDLIKNHVLGRLFLKKLHDHN